MANVYDTRFHAKSVNVYFSKPNISKCYNLNFMSSCDKFPCMYKHCCLRCGILHSMLHCIMTTPIACPLTPFAPSVPTMNHNSVVDHKQPPQIVISTTLAKHPDYDSETPNLWYLGLVPKGDNMGQRLITYLSFPKFNSVYSFIDPTVHAIGGIRHTHINPDPALFQSDGVHLSPLGNYIFLNYLQGGLEAIVVHDHSTYAS